MHSGVLAVVNVNITVCWNVAACCFASTRSHVVTFEQSVILIFTTARTFNFIVSMVWSYYTYLVGACGSIVVKALCYKPEVVLSLHVCCSDHLTTTEPLPCNARFQSHSLATAVPAGFTILAFSRHATVLSYTYALVSKQSLPRRFPNQTLLTSSVPSSPIWSS
jgi:hypothetical protein